MGIQFESVTTAPDSSLTMIVDDLLARSSSGSFRRAQPGPADTSDLEAWVNALLRQSTPIVASRKGRAQLNAWLAALAPAED